MKADDDVISCERCGCRTDAGSEEQAEAYGWLVDRASEPHRYTCPACRETARP
jgi:hypothetical protein